MRIEKFENLECWQEARKLAKLVYGTVWNGGFRRDLRLKDQITGATISVMNNIAEGFSCQSNTECVKFLRYSRRSAAEVQSCLYIASDQNYLHQSDFEKIYQQAERTRKLVDGFIRYLRTNSKKDRSRSASKRQN
jgi:four helix bundle protein